MLKERAELVRGFIYVAELFVVSTVFFGVYFFFLDFKAFYGFDLFPEQVVFKHPASVNAYLKVHWLTLFLWAVIFRVRGGFHQFRVQTHLRVVFHAAVDGAIFFACLSTMAFLLKFHFLSRLFMIAYTAAATLSLVVERTALLAVASAVRKKGYNYRNLLIVGTGRRAQEFISLVDQHREWGYRIIGLLDADPRVKGQVVSGHSVVGVFEDLPALLEKHVVDEVVFVVPRNWIGEIENCILYCEAVGVPATLSTDFFDLEIAHGVPKEFGGFTYLTFETSRLKASELVLKRAIDIAVSGAALVALGPIFMGVALIVKITSPGPVFFRQTRVGRNGRRFILYKFRSMVEGAETRLDDLKALNEMSGPVFKMKDDPRLTKVGKFLRRTSLDELPQLWNVLKGDMSLVGPRPPIPGEVERYETWQRRRLSMKPGITCIWQVSGRNRISFEEWMKLDLQYIDRWSLWLDLKLLALTVKAVLSRHGAD